MTLEDVHQHPFEMIKMPSEGTLEGLRAWILRVSEYLGVTPTELARTAKVAPSTINKFMADTTQTKGVTARTVQKLIQAAHEIHSRKFSEAYGNRSRDAHTDPAGYSVVNVRVGSSLRAGAYKANHLWPIKQQFFITVLLPNILRTGPGNEEALKPAGLQGMAVTDNHADRVLPLGSIAICARMSSENEYLELGDYVVVSRPNDAGETELTIRHFIVSPVGDMWLIPQGATDQRPHVYLGRSPQEVKFSGQERFKPIEKTEYTIEYKIISALTPVSGAALEGFAGLKFP